MTDPEPFDAVPGDELAVVEADALQVVAGLQVLQALVRDERAVVQLQNGQVLGGARPRAQHTDPLVRDQLTVRQRLNRRHESGERVST